MRPKFDLNLSNLVLAQTIIMHFRLVIIVKYLRVKLRPNDYV